jgi:hypothetical protein
MWAKLFGYGIESIFVILARKFVTAMGLLFK